ncbi:MAG: glycosyltransferase, partial [Thiohalocapsa sp.]
MQAAIANKLSALGLACDSPAPYLGNPYLLGYSTLGPVLLGFTLALLEFAQRADARHLCFLARDGYVLKEAYDAIVPYMNSASPSSSYVAASRFLCAGADLDSLDRVLEVAAVPHHPVRIRDLLINRFGLDEQQVAAILEADFKQQGLTGPDDIVAENDPGKLGLLRAISSQLITASERRAQRYAGYLNTLSIDFEHAAGVDIGYAGSAQGVIARLTNAPVRGFYAITSDRIEKVRAAGLDAEGWLADGVSMGDHWFFEHVQTWEMFFSASHGSTIDISVDGEGAFEAILDDNLYPPPVQVTLSAIHRGAVEFARDFVATHGPYLWNLSFAPDRCCLPLREYFSAPHPADCIDLSDAVFEDRFGGDVRVLAAAVHPQALEFDPVRKAVVWPEATEALSCASPTPLPTVYPATTGPVGTLSGRTCDLIDGFSGFDTAPSWQTQEYERVFDSQGWPVPATRPLSMHLVFPVAGGGPAFHEALKSISDQAFSGLAVTVAVFENVATEGILDDSWVDSLPLVAVRSWADVVELMKSVREEWVLLNDGYTAFDAALTAELAGRIREAPETDVIVFDDDWRRADGTLERPHFKPQWSRELLLCTDYFGGAFAVRREFLAEARPGCRTAAGALWELALRVTTKTERVDRIPRVLAHRSIDAYEVELSDARAEIRPVLADVLAELGSPAQEVTTPAWSIESKRLVFKPEFADEGPQVAIIIPTKNQHEIVRRCIESLWTSTYHNFRIYLVDNESDEPASLAYFEHLAQRDVTVLRVKNQDGAFSYSYVNN